MLGKTNGTVINAFTSCCPGKDLLYKRYAPGIATTTVRTVDKAACQRVNQIMLTVFGSKSKASQSPDSPKAAISVIGQ
jgi:hypothetical protein